MSLAIYHRIYSFVRLRHAASTVEFAFLLPAVLVLLLMGFDTGRYVLATQRIQEVANSVAEMLSQTAAAAAPIVPMNPGDGVVRDSDLHYYSDSAMATYPEVLAAANTSGAYWWQLLKVQMTSVKFSATLPYTPTVMWTTAARTCGLTLTSVSDTNTYSPSTLPKDVFGPGSIIVVDVSYTFTPTFGAAYLPSIPIERSAFMAPRNVPYVESQATSMAPPCAGVTAP